MMCADNCNSLGRGLLRYTPAHGNLPVGSSNQNSSSAANSLGRGLLRYSRLHDSPPAAGSISENLTLVADPPSMRSRLRQNPRKTQHFITVCEAVEHVNDRTTNIVILPPDNADRDVATDEEISDDEIEDGAINDVAGELEVEDEDCDSGEEMETVDSSSCPRWRKHNIFSNVLEDSTRPVPLDQSFPVLATLTPFQIWNEVFDENLVELLLSQTRLYARRDKGYPDFDIDEAELESFLGIILFSGYHRVPSERDYWSTQIDLKVDLIADTMPHVRFLRIKSFIHLADNSSSTA